MNRSVASVVIVVRLNLILKDQTHLIGIFFCYAPCRCALKTLFEVGDVEGGAVLLKWTLSE